MATHKMPRPSNTEQRKAEIIGALLKVMARNGYEKASIVQIAKEAKLAPGLIHYHFKNKQEILIAMVNWIAEVGSVRLATIDKMSTTPWDRLKAFINARLATGEGESPEAVLAWVTIASESIRQPEIKELYEKMIAAQLITLQQLITAVAGKKLSGKEVTHLSAIVLSAMEGAFQLSATANHVMPKNYASDSIIELLSKKLK
jgi:TetR/AcrR family transcriptional repressor of bet genes